ncbi:unnamed protein product [Ilex paraguariensis]|uniref:CRAL-TRIO domain-containing protein n=1 Tax=Ilex paraguariensis TaxID=185542 RepID=A0ABC8UYK6_9AQUA
MGKQFTKMGQTVWVLRIDIWKNEGRPVMVVVGAHFLLRCLDLEQFVLYVVKELEHASTFCVQTAAEFESLIQKPYCIVYLHSEASLQMQPDLGWMRRLQQILGRKHKRHKCPPPNFGLKAAILALQLFVDNVVWKKVVYVDGLLQLFRYVPRTVYCEVLQWPLATITRGALFYVEGESLIPVLYHILELTH